MVNFMCGLGGYFWVRLAFKSVDLSKQIALCNVGGPYPIS